MTTSWSIRLARVLFITIAVLLGAVIAVGFGTEAWQGTLFGLIIGLFVVLVDALLAQFSFREFSNATFGLMIGVFGAWLLSRIGLFQLPWFQNLHEADSVQNVATIASYLVLGFLGVTMALRSDRDQFSFIIPYVRFRRDASEGEPVLLDANVLIDGRFLALIDTGFLTASFVVPNFVLTELQRLSESSEIIDAARGRRGLDHLQTLKSKLGVALNYHEDLFYKDSVSEENRLVQIARELKARILSHDPNLERVAKVNDIVVLNINSLAKALEFDVNVGDQFHLGLLKPGKDKNQAVGYLPNGAMIVVNNGASFIGETVPVVVSGMHQTSAGRLIFAELIHSVKGD